MELKTKKRIVGFMLIIALGLIIIPLLFGRSVTSDELKLSNHIPDRPEQPAALAASIPAKEATVAKVQAKPVPQSSSSSRIVFEQVPATSLGSTTQKTTTTPSSQPAQKPPATTTTTAATSKATTKPVTKKPPVTSKPLTAAAKTTTPAPVVNASVKGLSIAPSPESWVVQAGSFSEKANAETLMKKIQAAGFPAYLTTSNTSKGKLVRVYVGPEILKDVADKMKVKLAQSLNINGIVVKAGS